MWSIFFNYCLLVSILNHVALTASVHTSTIARPNFRLLLGILGSDEVPLYPGAGVHFSYIYVGTPPQRVSVIVDTGSHYTAFPCVGCRNCGTHTDPYFNWEQSSTSKISNCNGCKNTCTNNKCMFSQSYTEGSSWQAFRMQDKVWLGAIDYTTMNSTHTQSFAIDFSFGCQTSETGLFRSQLPDGIMGMSAQPETLLPQLKSAGLIDREIFALCFSQEGGVLSIGGVDDALHTSAVSFVPLVRSSGWFTVKVIDVMIGNVAVGGITDQLNGGKGVIVDSGTTDTYLPRAIANKFKIAWEKATGMNLQTGRTSMTPKEYSELPDVIFVFESNVKVNMKPPTYLERVGKDSYEWRIFLTEPSGSVLGANFMNDHDVIFDRDGKRIGFASAICDLTADKRNSSTIATPAPTMASHHHHDEPVDCVLSTFMPTSSCNVICSGANYNATGFQSWSVSVLQEPLFGGRACPKPLPVQSRPCDVECVDNTIHDDHDDEEEEEVPDLCATGLWSLCKRGCSQERMTGKIDLHGSCSYVHETRSCHSGQCPVAEGDFGIKALLTLTGVRLIDWNYVVDEQFAEVFSSAVHVYPGDVDILNVEQSSSGLLLEVEIRIVEKDSDVDAESRSEIVYLNLKNQTIIKELESEVNNPVTTMLSLAKKTKLSLPVHVQVESIVFDVLTDHSEAISVDSSLVQIVGTSVTVLVGLLVVGLAVKRFIGKKTKIMRYDGNGALLNRVYELISSSTRKNGLQSSRAAAREMEVVPLTAQTFDEEI